MKQMKKKTTKPTLCIEHCEKQGIQQRVFLYTLNKGPYLKVKPQ